MSAMPTDGRFPSSRAYTRWKPAIRSGTLIEPFLVLLTGGIVLFLSPGNDCSTTLIEVENDPRAGDAVEILKSRAVLESVCQNPALQQRWKTDKDSAINTIRDFTRIKTLPGSDLIRKAAYSRQTHLEGFGRRR